MSIVPHWDERFAQPGFLFGEALNAFLQSQSPLLRPGMSVLAVADGEGRNGVWLAEQGLRVLIAAGFVEGLDPPARVLTKMDALVPILVAAFR